MKKKHVLFKFKRINLNDLSISYNEIGKTSLNL